MRISDCSSDVGSSDLKRMTWVVYADYFKFPWLRFRADGPSQGYDLFSQFSYVPNKKVKVLFRYRFRKKQENSALNSTVYLLENVRKIGRESFRDRVCQNVSSQVGDGY